MAKSPSSGEVLIIDDTLYNLQLLVTMLSKTGYVVRPANSGSVGLRTARQRTPDIVLLDINMPGMNGYQVCEALKADPALKDIPVLFISAHDEVFDKIRAFEVGGVDYITKPFQSQEVIARVQTHLMLHRREQELEAMVKQQRDYFQRMADLQNEFFTSAVHDLKNPLNLIIGNTYLLKDIISAEGNQYIERIEHAAGFMNVLISDMLDLARIESGIQFHKEEVLLQAYMQDIFRRQVQGNTRVEADLFLPDTDAIITVDPLRMERAIGNLLGNAIKFTPIGGHVSLGVEMNNSHYTVTIQDTGIGIPEAAIPYLFDRFYRVYRPGGDNIPGTGLGMAIVKAVIDQHGGTIDVQSTVGMGTTVTVTLPLE